MRGRRAAERDRRLVALVVAAVSITVLAIAAASTMLLGRPMGPMDVLLVAVFLALHSTALVALLGRSPLTDLAAALALIRDAQPAPVSLPPSGSAEGQEPARAGAPRHDRGGRSPS